MASAQTVSRIGLKALSSLAGPLSFTLILACVFTVFVTYKLSLSQLESDIQRNGLEHKSHIENLLWQLDIESLEHQLHGFVALDTIRFAQIIDNAGRIIEAGEPSQGSSIPVVVISLEHDVRDGRVESIGTLNIHASNDSVWSLVRRRVLELILIYLATTAIVSLLILRQFNRKLLSPILALAEKLRNPPTDLSELQIDLKRDSASEGDDELSELVDAVHQMRDQILLTRAELEQGEKRLAQAAKLAGLGYCTFDAGMERIIDCDQNYADFHQQTIETMRSLDVNNDIVSVMLNENDVPHALSSRQRILQFHRDTQTYQINYPKGQFRHIREIFFGRFDEDEKLIAVDSVAQDVTEEILKQGQLLQSQKNEAIGKLTGGVAHDFNNILAVMLGNIELLQRKVQDPAVHQYLDATLKAVHQGEKLTQQLLSFARKQPLSPKVIHVGELINSSAMLLQSSVGQNIHLEIDSDAGLWRTLADPVQLNAVLLNLVINARDAMNKGGALTLGVNNTSLDQHYANTHEEVTPGDYVCISIADTGTGMSPELAMKAIEPFFTSKEVGKGTGLGLSMAFGFARQSGGHLKIYSEPGQGTTVKLYLPRVLTDITDTAPDTVLDHSHILSGLRVFLIEDNDRLRKLFSEQIRSLGCIVYSAGEEVSALALTRQVRAVDIILSDIMMPGSMDGRALTQHLLEFYPDARVVFMSGFAENSVVHDGRLDDGVVFLQKPFRLIDLARVLAENA